MKKQSIVSENLNSLEKLSVENLTIHMSLYKVALKNLIHLCTLMEVPLTKPGTTQ